MLKSIPCPDLQRTNLASAEAQDAAQQALRRAALAQEAEGAAQRMAQVEVDATEREVEESGSMRHVRNKDGLDLSNVYKSREFAEKIMVREKTVCEKSVSLEVSEQRFLFEVS